MENCYEYEAADRPIKDDEDLASGILLAIIVLAVFSAIMTINIETGFAMNAEGQIQQSADVQVAE